MKTPLTQASGVMVYIYMTHEIQHNSTTYVVVCSDHQSQNEVVKERLTDMFRPPRNPSQLAHVSLPDPYLLHLIVTREAFLEANTVITNTRYKLYDALDSVDYFSQQPPSQRSKEELEHLTIQLHVVSQDTDCMTASADMAGMILRRMGDAHRRYAKGIKEDERQDALTKTTDAINYLSASIESQMRWLNSYKSRKNIAMNLVSLRIAAFVRSTNFVNAGLQPSHAAGCCH
jgi:hypothetical protein